jgi:hypothetical protein
VSFARPLSHSLSHSDFSILVSTSADRPGFLRDTIVPLRDVVTLLPEVAIILHDVNCILPDVSDFVRMVNGGELPRGSSEEGDNELVARAETDQARVGPWASQTL